MDTVRIYGFCFVCIFNLLLTTTAMAAITLSEIMFDPLGNENYEEFVEIYNTGPDSVDLTGWQISDQNATDALQAVENSPMTLAPQAFAIILDPGYFENSTVYDALIPPSVLRLTLDNNTFGSGGLSNSTAKTIQLIDASGSVVSSYQYSLGNTHGYSDEKIILSGENTLENWADAQLLHGTPGFANSVTPLNFDLAISASEISLDPPFPTVGESVRIRVPVSNRGQQAAENFTVSVSFDANQNGIFESREIIGQQNSSAALALDHVTAVDFTWSDLPAGTHSLQAVVTFVADENPANNQAVFEIIVAGTPPEIVVNEIMFQPVSGEPEWFEIYNSGTDSVNLRDWQFADSRINSKALLSPDDFWLTPEGFAVVAANNSLAENFPETEHLLITPGSFPGLNNNGDAVVLWDALGRQIDSVFYRPEWGGDTGISLERKSPTASGNLPESWGSSQAEAGATPGTRNSWLPPVYDLAIEWLRVTPARMVAPAEITLEVQIKNTGENPVSGFELFLFEDLNENQQFDASESIQPAFSGGTLAPGAAANFSAPLEIQTSGIHFPGAFLVAETDLRVSNNLLIQSFCAGFPPKSLVINEVMYKAAKGQAEWIEFLNPGSEAVSVRDWSLTDSEFQHQVTLTDSNFQIEPGQFFIIANDAVFLQQFPSISCPVLILSDLPVLNNDADEVVLMDCAEFTVDSLRYNTAWAPETGVSLERVFWRWHSTDYATWKPSEDPVGATPGAPNSVVALDFDLVLNTIQVTNALLHPGDSIRVELKIENRGKEMVPAFGVNFYNNLAGDSLIGEPVARFPLESTLVSGDSLRAHFTLPPSLSGSRWLIGEIDLPEDKFPADNFALTQLKIGFAAGSLVINEIMYTPFAGQAEWIEIYNPGQAAVDLSEWLIADSDFDKKLVLPGGNALIPPEGFAVITGDSSFLADWPEVTAPVAFVKSFPSLNNESDQVWLFDLIGAPMDSVFYHSSWGGETGISLERINPAIAADENSNWNSCVFPKGGSPGARNSIWIDTLPAQAGLSVSPDPFSPDNDGFDDFTAISYELPLETARVNLKIFDVRGRLIRTLLNAEASGARRTILWDGRDDQNQLARMGIYVIYLEALNEMEASLTRITKTVVLANRLD